MDSSQFQKKLLSIQESMMQAALKLTANVEDARDLLHDTILRALGYKDKFAENINLKGWLYTLMYHIFINNYHKKLRVRSYIQQSEDLYNLDVEDNSGMGSPESDLDIKEIIAAIDSLDESLKKPFILYKTGFKYSEIADMLNIPMGTVQNHIYNARQTLQKKLKDFR